MNHEEDTLGYGNSSDSRNADWERLNALAPEPTFPEEISLLDLRRFALGQLKDDAEAEERVAKLVNENAAAKDRVERIRSVLAQELGEETSPDESLLSLWREIPAEITRIPDSTVAKIEIGAPPRTTYKFAALMALVVILCIFSTGAAVFYFLSQAQQQTEKQMADQLAPLNKRIEQMAVMNDHMERILVGIGWPLTKPTDDSWHTALVLASLDTGDMRRQLIDTDVPAAMRHLPDPVPRINDRRFVDQKTIKEPSNEVGERYYIYQDDAKASDFIPDGWMPSGPGINQNTSETDTPHSKPHCIRVGAQLSAQPWAGIYFLLEGVWEPVQPFNLFQKLDAKQGERIVCRFWARSKVPTWAQFKVGGVTKGKVHDSLRFPVSSPWIKLEPEWKRYEIDLTGKDLSSLVGGFCWVCDRAHNGAKDVAFDLDDIYFVKVPG
jgi:hypothetical protein